MNTHKSTFPKTIREAVLDSQRASRLAISIFLASAIAISGVGCPEEKAKEAVVPVTAANAQKATVQRVVTADAVLFPLQQAAIVPKISAPGKQFYVNRGSKVRKGQLLAVLENSDLAAAQEGNKGAFERAEATYVTGASPGPPGGKQEGKKGGEMPKRAGG